jgi:hypothetical protein
VAANVLSSDSNIGLHRGTKKKYFFGALVFRPVSGVIWGADSEKCIG